MVSYDAEIVIASQSVSTELWWSWQPSRWEFLSTPYLRLFFQWGKQKRLLLKLSVYPWCNYMTVGSWLFPAVALTAHVVSCVLSPCTWCPMQEVCWKAGALNWCWGSSGRFARWEWDRSACWLMIPCVFCHVLHLHPVFPLGWSLGSLGYQLV